MGTLYTTSFEGTSGAALTAALLGGSPAVNSVSTNSGTAAFDNSVAWSGSTSGKFVFAASGNVNIVRLNTGSSNASAAMQMAFYLTSLPVTTPWQIMTPRFSTGKVGYIQIMPSGAVQVLNTSMGVTTTIATITAGQWVLLDTWWQVTTATTGSYTANLYNTSGTLLGTSSSTSYNLGTANIVAWDLAFVNSNSASGSTIWIDAAQSLDGATAPLGFPIAFQSVTVSGSGSVSVGTAQQFAQPVTVSGSGLVNTIETPQQTQAVTISGSGSVSVSATQGGGQAVTVSGSSSVSVSTVEELTQSVTVSGSGSVSVVPVPSEFASVTVSGSGTLSVSTVESFAIAPVVSGSGTVSVATTPSQFAGVSVFGTGTVSVSLRSAWARAVTVSGVGIVSLSVIPPNATGLGRTGGVILPRRFGGVITTRHGGVISPRRFAGSVSAARHGGLILSSRSGASDG